MTSNWYYRDGAVEAGPVSTDALGQLLHSGRLKATDFVRGEDGSWQPAGACIAGSLAVAPPPMRQVPPPLPAQNLLADKPLWPVVAGATAVMMILGIVVLVIGVAGDPGSDADVLVVPGMETGVESISGLVINGEDATEELARLLPQLSDRHRTSLGLRQLPPGQDLYGARVRIVNQGQSMVYVQPEKIRLHLNGDSVGVLTVQDVRFLQPALLKPGHYLEGLVVYRAYAQAGAALRRGQGTISYAVESVR